MRYQVLYDWDGSSKKTEQPCYIETLRLEVIKLITDDSPPTESLSEYLHDRGLYTKNLIARAWCSIYYPRITLSEKEVFILRLSIPDISFRKRPFKVEA